MARRLSGAGFTPKRMRGRVRGATRARPIRILNGGDTVSVDKQQPQSASDSGPLASPELAALYIRQGEFDRGIDVYRELIARHPEDTDLKLRLIDAEALASLLTLRGEPSPHEYQRGYQAGLAAALDRKEKLTREERIARLNAWLDRVKHRYG